MTLPNSSLSGIFLKIASVMVFVAMASLIKAVGGRVPPGEAVFFRSAFAVPVIVVWLVATGRLRRGLVTRNPRGHFLRGFMGTLAIGCSFAGLALLPLPEVTALGYALPLLVVVFAALFLGEDVRVFRISMVLIGMVGVLIILWPRLAAATGGALDRAEALGAVLVLAGATCGALAQVLVRKLVSEETTSAIVFYFSVNSALLALLTLPFGWTLPSAGDFAMLVTAGLLGGIGQVFLTSSYRYADVSVVAPFEYTSMLLALAVGYLVFDEVPTLQVLGGALLIVAAGILIIWREARLGLSRRKQRKAMSPP